MASLGSDGNTPEEGARALATAALKAAGNSYVSCETNLDVDAIEEALRLWCEAANGPRAAKLQ